jgi:hypothetical protein
LNWEAVGAIAELLGATGVIASLVYLASQIRDTRRALRSSTYHQVRQDIHETMNSAVTAPALAGAVRAAWNGLENLSDEDAFRFVFWITGVMHSFDNCYYQYRMGMLDQERWEMHRKDLALLLQRPAVAHWWLTGLDEQTGAGQRSTFSPKFAEVVSELIAETPS